MAEIAASRASQTPETTREYKKAHPADYFYLTMLVREGYLASSPQAVVVARRLPAQPVVG
jgi:hypothetical protein